MHGLELRIPPPAIAALIAAAMWGISFITPSLDVPGFIRVVIAAAFALAGFGIGIAGVIAFRRAKTTVNPMKPLTASALVTTGVYKLSRNPIYVGDLCILVAWALYLSNVYTLIGPVIFVIYINRFQIAPEERALAALFGATYADYQSAVRRWL
jgi:protein-S-isoprenylcysteine O-methyltransferase Ste14